MKKILVVEDEYYARKSIVKILQESDLDIQVCGEAENGMKAIELLEEYKDIALVITDIQMQKMGGLELASYLHKHIPEIDVLILTAFENFDYAREALRYNVKDYIVKPIYKENLLPPVKKVLEKQEEKSRNQEKIKNYYQWEAAKNYFPVKTIVAHEELYKEFFSYNAIHQEEKFCIVVMQEEELVTDVELVNRIIQEKYRGFIKDFFFSKINEEYVMLLSGIECMDNELIVQEKVESMLSYFCTCKHMNITMGVGLVYSSKEKIYQSYNEALYALNQRLIQGWNADSYTDELLDAISWIDIFIGSEFVYEKMLEAGKSVKENCEYLYNKGPEIVIFTFGEKGCAGISKEGFFEIPAFDVDVKDTVGAGDVFHGAFLAAIVKGLSPKDAARFASGVAAIKCTRIGGRAGIPNWEVTDNFLETGEIDYREIDERVKKYGRGIEYV